MCATQIARLLKKRYVDEIFLLGLLHSLGQIVFLAQNETSKDYKLVLDKIKSDGVDYATAEQEVFGFAHPLIGALVAKKWNFSPETCQVILHYRDPLEGAAPTNEQEEKTAIVRLADAIAHSAGIGSPEGYGEQDGEIKKCLAYLQAEGNTEELLEKLVTETREQFENEGSIYS